MNRSIPAGTPTLLAVSPTAYLYSRRCGGRLPALEIEPVSGPFAGLLKRRENKGPAVRGGTSQGSDTRAGRTVFNDDLRMFATG